MDHVVSGLEDPNTNVKLAAVKCLHSLSRSVQQLRTSFQDTAVWKPIMKLLQDANDNMMTVASSALCNLLLEFSPSKEVNMDVIAWAIHVHRPITVWVLYPTNSKYIVIFQEKISRIISTKAIPCSYLSFFFF